MSDLDEVLDKLEKAKQQAEETYKANGRNAHDAGVYEGLKRAQEIAWVLDLANRPQALAGIAKDGEKKQA